MGRPKDELLIMMIRVSIQKIKCFKFDIHLACEIAISKARSYDYTLNISSWFISKYYCLNMLVCVCGTFWFNLKVFILRTLTKNKKIDKIFCIAQIFKDKGNFFSSRRKVIFYSVEHFRYWLDFKNVSMR